MASGMSKQNARQGKANEGRYASYKSSGRTMENKAKKMLRHMRRLHGRGIDFTATLAKMDDQFRAAWARVNAVVPNGTLKRVTQEGIGALA